MCKWTSCFKLRNSLAHTENFSYAQARERDDPVIPACGYVKHGKGIVTKHDLAISGRKNAERIMNLPPGINTGDGGGFDMHLSNKVCFCFFCESLENTFCFAVNGWVLHTQADVK